MNSPDNFRVVFDWLDSRIIEYWKYVDAAVSERDATEALHCLQLIVAWKKMKKTFKEELS